MKFIKKYWSIVTTIIFLSGWVVTIMWYGRIIDSNTKATTDNTESNTALIQAVGSIQQWMIDHDKRHEDHLHLHEAERR